MAKPMVSGTDAWFGAGAPVQSRGAWTELEGRELGHKGQLIGIRARGCSRRPRLLGMGMFSHS